MLDNRFMCLIHENYRRKLSNHRFPKNPGLTDYGMATFGEGTAFLELVIEFINEGEIPYPAYELVLEGPNGLWLHAGFLDTYGEKYDVNVDWAADDYKAQLCNDMRKKFFEAVREFKIDLDSYMWTEESDGLGWLDNHYPPNKHENAPRTA